MANMKSRADTLYREKNYKEAFEIFKLLAEKGDNQARIQLAEMYFKGDGVKASDKEAFIWYSLSILYGDNSVQHYRDSLKTLLSQEQLKEAQTTIESKSPK